MAFQLTFWRIMRSCRAIWVSTANRISPCYPTRRASDLWERRVGKHCSCFYILACLPILDNVSRIKEVDAKHQFGRSKAKSFIRCYMTRRAKLRSNRRVPNPAQNINPITPKSFSVHRRSTFSSHL